MNLQLWQHVVTNARYIVLTALGIVLHAAGPLDAAQLAAAQADEWNVPWRAGLAAWVEARRGEFEQVWPQAAQA